MKRIKYYLELQRFYILAFLIFMFIGLFITSNMIGDELNSVSGQTTTNAIYLNPEAETSGDGLSKETAVNSFEMAKQLVPADGIIYICNELKVTGDMDGEKDGQSITLKRDTGYKGVMLSVASNITANIKNLIVDGGANEQDNSIKAEDRLLRIYGTTTITNCTLRNNYDSMKNGGGVYNSGTFTMIDSTISGNTAPNGGGVYIDDGATFNMEGSTISGNSAYSNIGGGVYINYNATFTMTDNSTISGNTSIEEAGGVYINYESTFTMTDSTISNNKASNEGGGVSVNEDAVFNMTNSIISDNSADEGGGAYIESNAVFTMSSGEISNNTATGKGAIGGGICIDEYGKFNMNGGKISSNKALYAGGIYIYNNGIFEMNDGTISGNTASSSGGGVHVYDGGTFKMNSGTISSNTANDYGGGVYNCGTVTMENGTISDNKSLNGAGVCVNNSTFNINGGTVTGNQATKGGGVYVDYGIFNMNGGTVSKNTASDGAGIYIVHGEINMYDATISSNKASNGAGVYIDGGTFNMNGGTINGNESSDGGGVYVQVKEEGTETVGVLKVSGNVNITGNTKSGSTIANNVYTSGEIAHIQITGKLTGTIGIANVSIDKYLVAKSDGNYQVTSDDVSKFSSDAGSEGYGLVSEDENVSDGDTRQSKNIYVKFLYAEVYLDPLKGNDDNDGSKVDRPVKTFNKAKSLIAKDGTIYLCDELALAEDIDGEKNGQRVVLKRYADYKGVMLSVANSFTVNISNLIIDGGANWEGNVDINLNRGTKNTGVTAEGQLLNTSGTTTIANCTLRNNSSSSENGGGVYVNNNGLFAMTDNSTISDNSASYKGGGVYVDTNAAFKMTGNSAVNSCTAPYEGGGVYVASGGKFMLTGSKINGNKVSSYGGGVRVAYNGTFEMNNGIISENSASYGSGVYVYNGIFNMTDSTVNNNNASHKGGGVCIGDNGSFNMNGGMISDNTASYEGGGIYVNSNGTCDINGGSINSNNASNGGGVYIDDGTFNMNNGTISGNTASSGSVYVGYGTFNMNSGMISGNQAVKGGGVYLANNYSFYTISGQINISDNTKTDNTANNLYIDSSSIPMQIEGELKNESKIGISTDLSVGKIDVAKSDGNYAVTESDANAFFADDSNSYNIIKENLGTTNAVISISKENLESDNGELGTNLTYAITIPEIVQAYDNNMSGTFELELSNVNSISDGFALLVKANEKNDTINSKKLDFNIVGPLGEENAKSGYMGYLTSENKEVDGVNYYKKIECDYEFYIPQDEEGMTIEQGIEYSKTTVTFTFTPIILS